MLHQRCLWKLGTLAQVTIRWCALWVHSCVHVLREIILQAVSDIKDLCIDNWPRWIWTDKRTLKQQSVNFPVIALAFSRFTIETRPYKMTLWYIDGLKVQFIAELDLVNFLSLWRKMPHFVSRCLPIALYISSIHSPRIISHSLQPSTFPFAAHCIVHGLNGPCLLVEGKKPRLPVVVAEKNFPEEERSRLIIFSAYVLSLRVRTTSWFGLERRVPSVD